MFFGEDRIYDFIRMIIAEDAAERNRAIAALKPYQKDDFKRIFRIMEDRPVTIRLFRPVFQVFTSCRIRYKKSRREAENL